jgi:hypothetical protein
MARLAGFAPLLLTLAILPSQCVLSQEAPEKKPTENTASEQATAERNARFSRTHCEVPLCVQKVLYFSNTSGPADLQDIVNAIRSIYEIQRVQQILTGSMIIIEGTAEQVALAEKLAAEVDKGKRRFGGLGYRVDVKIQESEGDKKLHSRLYSFVTEARQSAAVSIKRRPPMQVPKDPASASETKPPSDSSPSRSIECRILIENERTLEMSVEAEFASDTPSDLSGGNNPLLRIRENVTVELDRPTVIGRIDDPDGDRTFTLELTATRIKDKL